MDTPAHPFAVLADPVTRRIVEVLAVGEHSAGTLVELLGMEFGLSRTAVSHRLGTLRRHGVVSAGIDSSEPRSRSYRLEHEFVGALEEETERLLRAFDHRYGSAEMRAPLVDPARPCRRIGGDVSFGSCGAWRT
ncbi:hypothetical protein GCM10017608_23560 [Agromyces luteolus]|uniref:Helix-turn-helix domain-containing protein n=1 Tax=Agromyces luteolus TaxID=88373 RepID=A0A7C9LCV9_9MICO|nr:helix-turn-helix domain-containing protein [Agromyces luteolus]MUN06972.1 helix-turn-helix domain-containing protein [Agromyces luteolus]GLK28422.1 hypothetical protein GCM10017608_23560 [Agromyces luteolus]